jgi:hypothetical protein
MAIKAFIELESVGWGISTETAMVYPMLAVGGFDYANGEFILDSTNNEEWMSCLSKQDKETVELFKRVYHSKFWV